MSLGAGSVTQRSPTPFPAVGEFVRYPDPVTENIVVRLTYPSSSSVLPAPTNHFVSLRERFLVFSSDRTGKLAPFRLDLRSGVLKQIAETSRLEPRSLALDARERILYFIDGGALRSAGLSNRRDDRVILEDGVTAFALGPAPGEFLVIQDGALKRLTGNRWQTLVDSVSTDCLLQPGGKGCMFSRESNGSAYWYLSLLGNPKPVLLATGAFSNPFWSRDGLSLLFLRAMENKAIQTSEIHAINPVTREEQCVAPASQVAAFAPNSDDSVFVGASRSKAQPHIVLMLRSPHRELTLCEHRAKDPASVSPVFSPDSRRVYFESDRDGKTAIYSVNVERLVEPTVQESSELTFPAAA